MFEIVLSPAVPGLRINPPPQLSLSPQQSKPLLGFSAPFLFVPKILIPLASRKIRPSRSPLGIWFNQFWGDGSLRKWVLSNFSWLFSHRQCEKQARPWARTLGPSVSGTNTGASFAGWGGWVPGARKGKVSSQPGVMFALDKPDFPF